MSPRIDALAANDWPALRRIHAEGIATGHATFETEPPATWEAWDAAHRRDCRLAAREGEELLGWAALSPVSGRCVYGGVAEVSVYVGEAARGRGVGRLLLEALAAASEEAGLWTLQAGIFPENRASLGLHEACGFHLVGRRERIGCHQGTWRDVLLLERRA